MDNQPLASKGVLVCVGIGMTLGAHMTPIVKDHIKKADVVFCLASHQITETWICEMHPDVRSLQTYYRSGKDRTKSYEEMIFAILHQVYLGKRVVAAFYGHPGVFACVAHLAIEKARDAGYTAIMEPGISAEDCLYADLGIDPGFYGCTHIEATQFTIYEKAIDTSAYLIVWQAAIVGDLSLTKFDTGPALRKVFIDKLLTYYPSEHSVLLYEAPTLPINKPKIDSLPINKLITAKMTQETTLVIPPCVELKIDKHCLTRLNKVTEKQNFINLVK